MNILDLLPPAQRSRYAGLLDFSPEDVMSQAQFPGGVIPLPEQPFPSTAEVKGPSFAQRAGNFLMPAPSGMTEAGLLTDEDIEAAQRQGFLGLGASLLADSGPKLAKDYVSPMAALGRGIQNMQGTHKEAVNSAMAMRVGAEEFGAAKRKNELAKQIAEGRQAIIEQFPLPDTNDPDAMLSWLNDVIPRFIEISDEETVARLSEIYKPLASQQQQKEPGQFMEVPGPDGKPRTVYVTQSQVPEGGVPTYERPFKDSGATLLDEQRMFTRANMLGDDYRSVTKNIRDAAEKYATMVAAADGAKSGSPQAQIALVFAFMKTLDPTSVVRESEYATAKNAAGVPERIRNQYNKILDGSFLSPEQVEGFLREGAASAGQWKRQQDLHRKTYDSRARAWKIDPMNVTQDYFDGLPLSFGKGDAPAGSSPAGGSAQRRKPGESISDYLKRTRKQ